MAIGRFLAPLNGRMIQQQVERPYVDDIFDPLFNAEVTNYYKNLYGGLGGVGAGYAEMLENALTGKKGILGPGMGILSTFGRSMDKADDFILGGLTEGVNLLGRGMGGLNEAPQNPLKRIFVDDYNYEGTKLMAAAGNAMAKLAGVQTPLDQTDFNTLGDKVAGTAIDLATDPGIMGSQLARLNPNTPVGQMGRLLNDYDNVMANVAGNMAFPGGKALVGNFISRIKDVNKGLGAFTTGNIIDAPLKETPEYTKQLRQMVDDYVTKNGITPGHPEWQQYEDFIRSTTKDFKPSDVINAEAAQKRLHKMTASELLSNPEAGERTFLKSVINDSLKDLKTKYKLAEDADVDDVIKYLEQTAEQYDKDRLIPYLNDIRRTYRLSQQGRRTILDTDIPKSVLEEADALYKKGWNEARVEALQKKISKSKMNLVSKDEFVDRILTSPKQTSILNPTDAVIPTLRAALQHNVDEINKYSNEPLLTLIDKKTASGKVELGYILNTKNTNWIKDMKKVIKRDDLKLQDVIYKFSDSTVKFTDEENEVLNFFYKLDNTSKRYSEWLGFERKPGLHTRMVMSKGEDAAELAMKHYQSLGLSKDKADLLLAEIQDANNRLVKRGVFGTIDIANSYLGPLQNSPYKYNYDLRAIAASTFTDSYMNNVDVQSVVSLMDNPMFTIKQRFDSPKLVKQALDAGPGNQNLTLATLKFDAKGQISGFKRYDKFNNADIIKAYDDPNCILVPEDIVGHLEHAFLSKKRIPPKGMQKISQLYKSSILNNLGFPIGNFGDAFTKQSIEIGRHFGDTPVEAISKTATSMKNVLELNELFDQEVMKEFNAFLGTDAAKKSDIFRKYTTSQVALNSGTIFNNPELTKVFEEYVNTVMPSGPKRNLAMFYMDICGDVDLNIGKFRDSTKHVRFNKDLEEMNSMFSNNPYKEDSWVDKVLYGNRNSEHPVGIINNPLSKFTLGTSEDFIEPMARGGTYLNYLNHKGYDLKTILENIGYTGVASKNQDEFQNAINEAINAMYATNFNYESTSKFQKVFAKFVPFPTFYLKNIAFWLDVFDKNPQIIDNTLSLHEGLWAGKSTKDEFTAEAKGRGAVPFGQQNKHLTGLVKPTPYNSMFGAFNALNDPLESVAFRTNPLLRPVTRHLQDPEDVKYRPYNTNQYQKNIKKGEPEFSELAYMFHQLNPYEKFFNTYIRTPGKVSKNNYQMSDFLPSVIQPDFRKK